MSRRPFEFLGFTLREHATALAIFAAVTLTFFFPLARGETLFDADRVLRDVYPWASLPGGDPEPAVHYDLSHASHPWQVFMSRELRRGEVPVWDPHSFGGTPFVVSGNNGLFYPPRLALSLLVSPSRVHDVLVVTHFFLAGVAMFLLLGAVRLPFAPALVGGLAWMVNSFALSWQYLEHYLAIEVWLPVGVLLAHLALRRRSWPATFALALTLGLMFFGGTVLFVELAVAAIFGYATVLLVLEARRERRSARGNLARIGTAAGLLVAMSAVSTLPGLALAADTARMPLTYEDLEPFALGFSRLVNVLYARDIRIDSYHAYHFNLFAGSAVAVLAVVGLFRRNALALFAGGLGVLTLLFMLHTPVTAVVHGTLPAFEHFKPLARAAFLLQFAMAVLAAFGLDTVCRWLSRSRWSRRSPILRTIVPSAVAVAVAASIVIQAYRLADYLMPHQPVDQQSLFPSTPLIRFLQERDRARFIPAAPAFYGVTAMIHGLDSAGGYENVTPQRTENFWRALGNGVDPGHLASSPLIYAFAPAYELAKLRPPLLARAAVQYVVAAPASSSSDPVPEGLELRYDGTDGRVFSVPGALPRAYVVGGCVVVDEPLAALESFVAADFDAESTVILERPFLDGRPPCSERPGARVGQALVLERSADSLQVLVTARQDGWLVVTDTWGRGWTATLDGRSVDVVPANYAYRGIAVPAGTHTVRLEYVPTRYRLGAAISTSALLVTLGGLGWALVRGRRRTAT